jgi:type I restriction enzyme, S subunit
LFFSKCEIRAKEQQSIINYLDSKTTQIDNLILKKQKLIELLKEERSAIINQAVTKGLNPDAPMKDSGIEWLGGYRSIGR